MSDQSTVRMIEMYMEESSAPMFLSSFFQSPARNFHTSEKVEIDIMRDDETVAVVIQDLSAGSHLNESNLYQNKAFTPPIFSEMGAISSYKQLQRQAGQDPFQDPNYAANATKEAFGIGRKLEKKIRRAIELMSSQVLQTGVLTLTDENGVALYTLDFGMKSTHIRNAATTWALDGTTGAPLADIAAAAQVVRRDGKSSVKRLVFGTNALAAFLANPSVQVLLTQQGFGLGTGRVAPQERGEDANWIGEVVVGGYRYEMWSYEGFYRHPQTGDLTQYLDSDNLLLLSGARLDLSYGAIPQLRRDPNALAFLPGRMSSPGQGLDLSVNAFFTENGKNLMVEMGTRPLTIPTAIDGYAVLSRLAA